jgi:hypothetical protein
VVRLLAKKWAQRVAAHARRAVQGGLLIVQTMPHAPRILPTYQPSGVVIATIGLLSWPAAVFTIAFCLRARSARASRLPIQPAAWDEARPTGPRVPSPPIGHAGGARAQAGISLRCVAVRQHRAQFRAGSGATIRSSPNPPVITDKNQWAASARSRLPVVRPLARRLLARQPSHDPLDP